MTTIQQQLVTFITTKQSGKYMPTAASFNGNFLNCEAIITKANGKSQKQKFSFVFDDAEGCQGCRAVGKPSGTYATHFQRDTFELICEFSKSVASLEV
jgi:hypothetical protein